MIVLGVSKTTLFSLYENKKRNIKFIYFDKEMTIPKKLTKSEFLSFTYSKLTPNILDLSKFFNQLIISFLYFFSSPTLDKTKSLFINEVINEVGLP